MKLIDLIMTTGEAMQEFDIASRSNFVKAMKNGWKGFEPGQNCRKSAGTWLVTREAVEESYKKKSD